jgi:hypothetical protein
VYISNTVTPSFSLHVKKKLEIYKERKEERNVTGHLLELKSFKIPEAEGITIHSLSNQCNAH